MSLKRFALWFGGALLLLGLTLLLLLKPVFNISPSSLDEMADVAAGLSAKLACSGHYISGLDATRVAEDLATYSPALSLVDIHYQPAQGRAVAQLWGLAERSARLRPGLGCTLELDGGAALDALSVPTLAPSEAPWPLGSEISTVQPSWQERLDQLLARDRDSGEQSRALLLVRGGEIVAESYASAYDPDTMHLGWSMGKSVTAILLGMLEGDGLVAPGDKALFPAWQDDPRAEISVEQMLQMSSGLDFGEVYSPGSDATRMLFGAVSAAAVAMDKPLVHSPGVHFAYSSGTTNLLALLYHQRLGADSQRDLDYLYRRLFEPLAMTRSLLEPDPSGVFVGSSFIYASARDWGRLGQMLLNGGHLNGQRIVSADWVARASRANPSNNDPRYGYQFWLNTGGDLAPRWPGLPGDAYAMLGNRGQAVMIIPSLDTVAVRLGWSPGEYPLGERLAELLAAEIAATASL